MPAKSAPPLTLATNSTTVPSPVPSVPKFQPPIRITVPCLNDELASPAKSISPPSVVPANAPTNLDKTIIAKHWIFTAIMETDLLPRYEPVHMNYLVFSPIRRVGNRIVLVGYVELQRQRKTSSISALLGIPANLISFSPRTSDKTAVINSITGYETTVVQYGIPSMPVLTGVPYNYGITGMNELPKP